MADKDEDLEPSADDLLEEERKGDVLDTPLAFPGSEDDPAAPPDDVPPPKEGLMGKPSTDDINDPTETYHEGG